MPNSLPSNFQNCAAEFVAVLLASSVGSRLFPITSTELPKHMLPVAGIPVISRLLMAIEASGFQECVVVIARDDELTVPSLKKGLVRDTKNPKGCYQIRSCKPHVVLGSEDKLKKITILYLDEDCQGSIDALRKVEEAAVILPSSNMVVIPGDLVVFDVAVFSNLCDKHRQGYQGLTNGSESRNLATACTILLNDVGEQDEHGVPLKESAKQKKGGWARDEEDVEYIALAYPSSASTTPRIVLKQLKVDVHDNEAMLAETPKLSFPKPRLRVGGLTRVRTDWNDVHVYILSPWVRRLLMERMSLLSLQSDLLPLLIARQFQGIVATFGRKVEEQLIHKIVLNNPDPGTTKLAGPILDGELLSRRTGRMSRQSFAKADPQQCNEYAVLAHVQDDAVRTSTISSYLYASREILAQACEPRGNLFDKNEGLKFPLNSSVRSKFQSILLPGVTTGDKVTFKSAFVGKNCKLGAKCRLNNVVVMDDVTIGDNVILQNSIVGTGCKLGDNCNLNDCQLAPGKSLPSGEKAKGESFS